MSSDLPLNVSRFKSQIDPHKDVRFRPLNRNNMRPVALHACYSKGEAAETEKDLSDLPAEEK